MRGLPADGTLRKLSLSQRRGGLVWKSLVVMAVDSMLRRANRAQAGIQRLHDQALVGAERSRVGIRLGPLSLASRMMLGLKNLFRLNSHPAVGDFSLVGFPGKGTGPSLSKNWAPASQRRAFSGMDGSCRAV
jgi:hypothetical protein